MKSPLSKTQYGIYAECAGHGGEPFCNLPYIYVLDNSLDAERLCRAIETAVKAHPTVFTRIVLNDEGEPMQVVDDTETFALTIEDIDDIESIKPSLVVPFDIYNDRLFRIRLLRDTRGLYLFCDYHHIIFDGTSMQLMLSDIDKAYVAAYASYGFDACCSHLHTASCHPRLFLPKAAASLLKAYANTYHPCNHLQLPIITYNHLS